MKIFYWLFVLLLLHFACSENESETNSYDVIIIGGGASGVAAGLQASRQGAKTLVIEESEWLGGMLTAAGVSAIDGNNNLPSGIWGEFRDSLVGRYGSRSALETGWVSNTLFEPHIAQEIFTNMTSQSENLEIHRNTSVNNVEFQEQHWHITTSENAYQSKILIDATELGDIAAMLKIPFDIGMQDGHDEPLGPVEPNNIIQDLTWVATLEDYGPDADRTIPLPLHYRADEFSCACNTGKPVIKAVDCQTMLNYGKLPNGKYMINWPNCGNDIYVNVIELSPEERQKAYVEAKEMTLRFVYYIQHELGFKHLGLSESTYPTIDHLAMMPYHRESRRIRGKVRLLSKHLANPYDYNLYRTAVAVGDYPIDHHHKKNPDAPKIDFIGIKIPAYSIPFGALVPESVDQFIVAEKSISVSNIVNGTTRLQPVVLGIGQAAGAMAATAIENQVSVHDLSIRSVQRSLVVHGVYLQPFMDVARDDPDFQSLHMAGALGLLKGKGIPYKWANQMWVYPDSIMQYNDLQEASAELGKTLADSENHQVGPMEMLTFLSAHGAKDLSEKVLKSIDDSLNSEGFLTRRAVAKLVVEFTDLFDKPIDFQGNFERE